MIERACKGQGSEALLQECQQHNTVLFKCNAVGVFFHWFLYIWLNLAQDELHQKMGFIRRAAGGPKGLLLSLKGTENLDLWFLSTALIFL